MFWIFKVSNTTFSVLAITLPLQTLVVYEQFVDVSSNKRAA